MGREVKRGNRWRGLAALPLAALATGLLAVSGAGSIAPGGWTWDTPAAPGDPAPRPLVVAAGESELRELAAAGELVLAAAERDGVVVVGAGSGGDVELQPLAEVAGSEPLVVYAAGTPDGGEQLLVGVARSDVDRVDAILGDGTVRQLALNEWRAFAYEALSPTDAASSLVAYADGSAAGAVRVPATTVQAQGAAQAPRSGYTVSNRGREVPARQPRGRLFEDHPYRLFLLGTLNGRAFYRVQVTPRYTCWGAGKASRLGELGSLGCPNLVGAYPLQSEDLVYRLKPFRVKPSRDRRARIWIVRNREVELLRAGGIAVDQAATVALVDGAGNRIATTPVVDNLFSFPGPYPKKLAGARLVALDAQGAALEPRPEWGERQTPPKNLFGPRATRVEPDRLGRLAQRAAADGVQVSVGENGVVVFDGSAADARTRRLVGGRSVGFNCFEITGDNIRKTRSAGISGKWQPTVAFKILGYIKPPFDGCEIQGSYGHRWRDQYGTHSAVEVPLTERGRRYFEDRATARDLALFVRSRKTQQIRKLTRATLIAALRSAYGDQVAVLTSRRPSAPAGVVAVRVEGTRTIFSETSSLGHRFYVQLENGKITRENLRGLAFVF